MGMDFFFLDFFSVKKYNRIVINSVLDLSSHCEL